MKTIIQSVCVLFCLVLNAQMGAEFDVIDLQNMTSNNNSLDTQFGKIDFDDIDGSPYLSTDFKKGKIIETTNGQILEAYLRYNIFEDNFEVKPNLNDSEIFLIKRYPNYRFTYDRNKVEFVLNSKLFNNKDNGYAFVLLDGENFSLYKIYSQSLTPPKKGKTPYDRDKPASLNTTKTYLISKDISKNFTELDPHRRRILNAFDSNFESEMKDFMKSKNYKLRGDHAEIENQMIQIVSHYNSLLKK